MQKTKPPPDYITSKQLSTDHGIDAEQQLILLDTGKINAYRRTPGSLQPVYPSMNPPYAGCKNPKPFPKEGLPVSAERKAEWRQLTKNEIGGLDRDQVTTLYYNKDDIVALKRAKLHAPHKSTVTTPKKLTKVQQRVFDCTEDMRTYVKEKLEVKSCPMALVINLIQKQSFGQHLSGTPFSDDTIRRVIKDLFPSAGKVGRPPNK